jgi:hypothetical protein
MIPIPASKYSNPFTRHVKFTGYALATSVALLVSVDSAKAGQKEVDALTAALAPKTPQNATGDEFAAAVKKASEANTKLKPYIIAGEALRLAGSSAPDVGQKIAAIAPQLPGFANFNTSVDNQTLFAGQAAKTAGTGKALNVTNVPQFVAALRQGGTTPTLITDNEAIAIAKIAKASKVAVGAVLQGQATNNNDAGDVALLISAVSKAGGLSAAAQDAARGVSIATSNSPDLAEKAINGSATNLSIKLVAGAVGGKPQEAGAIVDRVLNLNGAATFGPGEAAARKGVASLAKAVGATADIEEIRRVATVIVAGDTLSKISQVTSITKTLAKAIMAKPLTATGPQSSINKKDELGELGAYVIGALITNGRFNGELANVKKTGSYILGIIKGIAAAKAKVVKKVPQGPSAESVAADVASSVAYTIENSALSTALKQTIKAYLLANSSKIAGKTAGPTVLAALNFAYGTDPTRIVKLENGLIDLANDPETDTRNF